MRLISWNVAARVKKQPQQLEAVMAHKPDLLALQEVTAKTARMWRVGLKEAGYEHILSTHEVHPDPEELVGGRGRAILIASRFPIEQLPQEGLDMPWKERLLSVLVQHPQQSFEFHTAYITPGNPHGWLKIETFEGIYNYLAHPSETPRILCGDYNSPKQELADGRTVLWGQRLLKDGSIDTPGDPRWPQGEKLVIRDLAEFDLPDIYRLLNGWKAEDYSWVVWRKGKIVSQRRFDHVFASKAMNPVSCKYIHDVRENWLSDHSAIDVEFAPGLKYDKYRQLIEKKTTLTDPVSSAIQSIHGPVNEKRKEKLFMTNKRDDIRDPDPRESHRTAFMAGWTRAVQGELFSTVVEKKTHANMGNLFGWVYGEQTREFKLATWYHYLEIKDYQGG